MTIHMFIAKIGVQSSFRSASPSITQGLPQRIAQSSKICSFEGTSVSCAPPRQSPRA